jgi:hypothetical protein
MKQTAKNGMRAAVVIAWCFTSMVFAAEGERLPVSNLAPLLKLAIDQGAARGILVGPAAEYARRKFDTDAPIEVDVRAIRALPQPGCSRLEVTTRQKNVLENGQRGDKTLRWQLSYCRDGHLLERQ